MNNEATASSFTIRAAQIDLNRQKETFSFVRQFVDFLADNGYNALCLYIGWRLRTESHPWPSTDEAYTPDEIREIVAYAETRGLQIIPATDVTYVPTILKYEEFGRLSEYALPHETRFPEARRGMFCPSNPEVISFLEHYLAELAELVPSPYMYVGGDEAWDIGSCERCRATGRREKELYRDFMLACHRIVTEKLGRRMIMWDDMFEHYPEVLPQMPRDIVMASWHYQPDVTRYQGHFIGHAEERRFELYDRLGFDYLIAPASYSNANGRTFTDLARGGKRLLGGIMTTWCTHIRFMYKLLPTIGCAGRYWARSANEPLCFKEMTQALFGIGDQTFRDAIRAYAEPRWREFPELFSENNLLTYPHEGIDHAERATAQLLHSVLEPYSDKVNSEIGCSALTEILLFLQATVIACDAKLAVRELLHRRPSPTLSLIIERLERLTAQYEEKWNLWRPGIKPNHIAACLRGGIAKLRELDEKIPQSGLLRVRFCLLDHFGAAWTAVYLGRGETMEILGRGVYKSQPLGSCFYERYFPFASGEQPESVRLEVNGYGAQGVAYIEAEDGDRIYVPERIGKIVGEVSTPNNLLSNDCRWSFLGESDYEKAWHDRAESRKIHSIEIKLASR
jgi:hypothetical protein